MNKNYKCWEKSFNDGEIDKQVTVKECENGYFICVNTNTVKNGIYKSNTKRYISKENPLKAVAASNDSEKISKEILDAITLVNKA